MPARLQPTVVAHFTRVEHLTTVIEHGLLSDEAAHERGLLAIEIGNTDIKDQRRRRPVPISPGGSVADYVPFYFGARSPMMFAIAKGNVPSYQEGTGRLIYLMTTLERLDELDLRVLLTDRNAALRLAAFREFDPTDPIDDDFIDWPLMKERYWVNFPDGTERRMAECLAYGLVPWEAFTKVVARNDIVAEEVHEILADAGVSIPVNVRPTWYF